MVRFDWSGGVQTCEDLVGLGLASTCMVRPTIDYGKGRPFPYRDMVNELESTCIPHLPLTGTIGAMFSAEYHFSITCCMNGENL